MPMAFLNAAGIGVLSRDRGGNVIEHCTAYGNQSRHGGDVTGFTEELRFFTAPIESAHTSA